MEKIVNKLKWILKKYTDIKNGLDIIKIGDDTGNVIAEEFANDEYGLGGKSTI